MKTQIDNMYDLEYSRVKSSINVIKQILSGDSHEYCFDQEPSRRYSIGIINPLSQDQEQLDEQKKKWIRKRRPDSLGFEARFKAENQEIQLHISIRFSVYYRSIPTLEEQRVINRFDKETYESSTQGQNNILLRQKYKRISVELEKFPLTIKIPQQMEVTELNFDSISAQLNQLLEEKASEIVNTSDCWFDLPDEPRIPFSSLESEEKYKDAIQAEQREKPKWEGKVSGKIWPTKEGHWRLNLLLSNISESKKGKHPVGFFNCKITCALTSASFISVPFKAAVFDYRYKTETWGKGINCVLKADEKIAETESMPIFEQHRIETRDNMKDSCNFKRLASDEYLDALNEIVVWLKTYSKDWTEENKNFQNSDSFELREKSVADFKNETQRFLLGIEALQTDKNLEEAFKLMNKSFSEGKHNGWRLFQLVFVVTQMPSLLARESNEKKYLTELDKVDVLWFPTGGGKTEAYFGVIITAMFYDRLRGKTRGVTAWIRYPLRMLSVQQLQRLVDIVTTADKVRLDSKLNSLQQGDPFTVGYYVGSKNTPNDLTQPNNPKFPGGPLKPIKDIKYEIENASNKDDQKYRVLQRCPHCGSFNMNVQADIDEIRLKHICDTCKKEAPIYITDTEIYRYVPSVIVGTVDRLAIAGQKRHFSHLFGQFTHKCPDHGYVSFNLCVESSVCSVKPQQYQTLATNYDPCPSLLLQDELHLLKESLGTYDSHYETFIDLLSSKVGKKLPPKRIAATATIEGYERHVWELYGREAIRFPVKGKGINDSAYTQSAANDSISRIYVGIMPTGAGTEETTSKIGSTLKEYAYKQITEGKWPDFITDNYDLSLSYVNEKNTAGNIRSMWDDVDDLQVLTGDKGLNEVRAVIGRVESDTDKLFAERLRSVVATSVISHGVDLERLNFMSFCGMPNHAADYIQASSRVGRLHVGVVFTVFRPDNNRERNIYQRFYEYHERLYQLVQPVPIIRFSESSIKRTLTGILSACILNILAYEKYNTTHKPLDVKKDFIAACATETIIDQDLTDIVKKAYKINDLNLIATTADLFNKLIDRLVKEQKNIIVNNTQEYLTYKCMVPRPVSSLREVSKQIGFFISPKNYELWNRILAGRRYENG